MKVYLAYPWIFPDSPYYKYLIGNPPEGVEYLNGAKQNGVITNRRKFVFSNKLKNIIRKSLSLANLSIPNAHKIKTKENYDLIHCAHCLCKNNSPWVADFESVWQFYVGKKTKWAKNKVKKILQNENCKKIMAWTEKTKQDIITEFPEIKDKVEVVYPAVPLQKLKKKENKKPTILYATRYFWIKGGLIALETLRRLKEKYDINIIFISDIPKEIKEKYKDIKILDLVPQNKLFEYYSKSDIFFYPSLMDTFGFSLLEAMSFGLPIVTVNTEATKTRREIIENEKTGFIFDANKVNYKNLGKLENKIISQLVKDLSKLVENRKLRQRMAHNCLKLFKNGKFSINKRNEKLKRIYDGAVFK